jgi:hypothetical protein
MNYNLTIGFIHAKRIVDDGLGLVARVPSGGNRFKVIFADNYELFSFLCDEQPDLTLYPRAYDNYEVPIEPVLEFNYR